MKRKFTQLFMLFSLLTFLSTTIFAQVQVGSGTSTGQALPIEPFYGYSYSQVIYLASEIGASGDITELQWYFAGSSLSNSNDWTIYIGHTTKTEFSSASDWVPVSSMTQVYSGTFTDPGAAGWITFDITDFTYNGTDNLVVAVDENASGYNGSGDDFNCSSVTGNRGLEYHNDSNNPDPTSPPDGNLKSYIANIIFDGITQSCPAPTAQTESNITTTSADLGWTDGSGSHWDIYVVATGGAAPVQGTTPTADDVTATTYTWSGGSANTTYDWYVRSDCGQDNSNTSTWTGPSTFTTLPGAHSFPLTEDFESGFAYFDNAYGNDVDFADETTLFHGGAHSVHNAYTSSNTNILHETGILDLSSTSAALIEFWHIAKTEGGWDKCYVEISTDGGASYSALPASTYQGAGSGYGTVGYFDEDDYTEWGTGTEIPDNTWWKKETFSLSSYNVANVRFRFKLTSDGSGERDGWYIDDIHIYEPSCPPPSAQTESNITTTSADLGWTENGGATTWDIEIVPAGASPTGTPTATGVTSNPYTYSNLNVYATYDWYVRADCGGGSTSTWTGPSTFTTACATVSTLSEDFTGLSTPSCWTNDGDENWLFSTGAGYGAGTAGDHTPGGGTNYAWIDGSGSPGVETNELLTPYIDVSGLSTPAFEFYFFSNNTNNPGDDNTLTVDFWDGAVWNTLLSYSGDNSSWQQGLYDLSVYTITGDVQFRFVVTGTAATTYYNDILIDDVSVLEYPSCPSPTAQTESNIMMTSAKLGWTETGTATTWNIEWGPTGFTLGNGTQVTAVTNPSYSLSGLTAATTYDWYVQADCGGGSTSTWTGPHTFTTADGKATDPYPADGASGVLVNSDTLKWNPVAGATNYVLNVGTTSGGDDVLSGYSTTDTAYITGSNWDYSTQYFWSVNTVYNGTNDTITGTEWNFTTECSVYTPTYSQDFENGGLIPNCWTNDPADAGGEWEFVTTSSHGPTADHTTGTGYYSLLNDYSVTTANSPFNLLTPTFDLSSGGPYQMTYWAWIGPNGDANPIHVDVSDDGGTTWTNDVYVNDQSTTGSWFENTVPLSSFSTNNVIIRFRGVSIWGSGTDNSGIDDVTVEEMPACPAPSAQTETNITLTSADLGWTETGTAATWNIEWGPTGFTQGSGTMVTGTISNPYTLSGLTDATMYDWYVQADCGGDQSTWTGPHTFQTLCDATTVPYFEDFDAVTVPNFPGCMTVENTNGDSQYWQTNASGLSAPNSAIIYYNTDGTTAMDDWFFTQELSLQGGHTYEVSFAFASSSSYPEKLAVDWGTAALSTAMSGTPIFDNNNILGGWYIGSGTFTPVTNGTYYVGFHGYSDADEYYLAVDDIQVVEQQTTTTWNGGVSNEWDDAENWSSGIPSSNTDVTIPTTANNFPTLSHARQCNTITIESDNTGDASILNDGLLVVSGNATIQRYLPAGKWHDFSPSAANQTLNAMYFGGSPNVWLTHYNEPDNSRTYMTTLTDTMPVGAGYEIWVDAGSPVTVNFIGSMNRSDVALTSTSTPPLSYTGADPLGYNLIGNPFASPLALDSGSWNMANVDSTFWVWDDGTYKDYNTVAKSGGMSGGIIPMGQGFFIHANAASPTITIPVAARVHSGQTYYKNANAAGSNFAVMSLRATYNTDKYDELNIAFLNGAKDEFENHDTRKMFAFNGDAPQVYAIIPDEEVSLNSLPVLAPGEEKTVEVGYKAGTNGQQTLVADVSKLEDIDVVLEDLKLNKIQNLNDNPVYTFDATTYQDPDRFRIHFNRSVTGIDNNEASTAVRAYSYNKTLYIVSKGDMVNQTKNLDVYDMLGRKVLSKKIPGGEVISIPVTVSDAYVVVRIISAGEVYTTKVFIK